MEKVGRRLEKLCLSKGGGVTLIKSTLSSIPTYFMSLFTMLIHVANKLEKLQRNFLWTGTGDTKNFYLVDWRVVCSPLKEVGLSIRKLSSPTKPF